MGISISLLDQQMIQMQEDEAYFKKDMDDKQQVKQEEEKLKKTVSDAELAVKGGKKHKTGSQSQGGTPPESAQTAYILDSSDDARQFSRDGERC